LWSSIVEDRRDSADIADLPISKPKISLHEYLAMGHNVKAAAISAIARDEYWKKYSIGL
jgi:hypothetical protein